MSMALLPASRNL